MNRTLFLVITLLQPIGAYACFDGSAYGINFSDGMLFLLFSFLGLSSALTLRVLRGVFQLYLPFAVALVASILPTLEWMRWGYGDCGYGFLYATQICAGMLASLLLYELIAFYRQRRAENRGRP